MTDQQSIKHFADQKLSTMLQQRWSTKLLGYDYTIKYRKGADNRVADALSIMHGEEEGELTTITVVQPTWLQEIKDSYANDEICRELIKELQRDPQCKPHFTFFNGVARYKNKLYVGNVEGVKHHLMEVIHASSEGEGGSTGFTVTYHRAKAHFYWPGMKAEIRQWVASYDVCQRNKGENTQPAGLLQPLPIPDQAWQHISMDFVEGLPKFEGKEVILVVVDRFTKYSHFVGINHPYTAFHVARIFMDNIYKLHGLPHSIVSDRDSIFISAFWQELFKLLGTELNLSTAYHPQTDGQT